MFFVGFGVLKAFLQIVLNNEENLMEEEVLKAFLGTCGGVIFHDISLLSVPRSHK